jgi:hypothetical protein
MTAPPNAANLRPEPGATCESISRSSLLVILPQQLIARSDHRGSD